MIVQAVDAVDVFLDFSRFFSEPGGVSMLAYSQQMWYHKREAAYHWILGIGFDGCACVAFLVATIIIRNCSLSLALRGRIRFSAIVKSVGRKLLSCGLRLRWNRRKASAALLGVVLLRVFTKYQNSCLVADSVIVVIVATDSAGFLDLLFIRHSRGRDQCLDDERGILVPVGLSSEIIISIHVALEGSHHGRYGRKVKGQCKE